MVNKKKVIDVELLKSLIFSGKKSKDICEVFNVSRRTLFTVLKDNNLSFKEYTYFNINIFDEIDTEEKAYWLGFLYADGYICGYNSQVELSLKGSDIDHLIKFKKFLSDTREDDCIKLSMVQFNNNQYSRCRYIIGNRYFHDRLIDLGCVPGKSTKLVFPDESIFKTKDLIRDFIRGYIDGNGCLYFNNSKLAIEISGTMDFLNSIRNYFSEFNIPQKDKRHNVYRIGCYCTKARLVANTLYNNSTIYLSRKYLKFAESCSNI